MYSSQMRRCYAQTRTIPYTIGEQISRAISTHSRVLDIGTGPGDLALQLSMHSSFVTGIDISLGFIKEAEDRARELGRKTRFFQFDANRLDTLLDQYDVVVASQVIHWLAPSSWPNGIRQILAPGGSLFFIESKPVLPSTHPLRVGLAFGDLSEKDVIPECRRHSAAYKSAFAATPPTSDSSVEFRKAWIYKEERSFDVGFAQSYFFPSYIHQRLPGKGSSRCKLRKLYERYPDDSTIGIMHWLLVHFIRSG